MMNENEARDLLKPFCESDSTRNANSRYALGKLGARSGWLCATNAHIAVCLPVPGVPDTPELFPEISTLPWSSKVVGPWPALESVGEVSLGTEDCDCWAPCDECAGSGGTKCPQCGQTVECKKCRGNELVANPECVVCAGKGQIALAWRFTRVEKKKIDEKCWRLIAALPGVQLAKSGKKWSAPIAFVFDGGGRGLVMPGTP